MLSYTEHLTNHSAILDLFCDLHQDSDDYILRCGRLVYRLKKLTLAKIDFKKWKVFMFNVLKHSFIYRMPILYPPFDFVASNNPKTVL